jgi:hypothetical protein
MTVDNSPKKGYSPGDASVPPTIRLSVGMCAFGSGGLRSFLGFDWASWRKRRGNVALRSFIVE